jgi:hypothetical protein
VRVDGGVVNPDHERRVAHEHERYRTRGIVAFVAGLVVLAAALGILFAVFAPRLSALTGLTLDVRSGVALVAAGLLCGGATMLLLWRASEARWKRVRSNPDLVRSAYPLFDAYGPPGGPLDDRTLWHALTEEQRIDELRNAEHELLAAAGDRSVRQQATLDTLSAEIEVAEQEQHARLRN